MARAEVRRAAATLAAVNIKDSLRLIVSETRAREAAELLPLCDDSSRPEGRWTVRDNLAHLAAWRYHAARMLEAAQSGASAPASPEDWDAAPTSLEDFDAQNRRIFEANKDLRAAQVKAEVDRSWERLSTALEASSETELHQPRPGHPDQQVWEVIPGNAHGHLVEHLGYWYIESGHVDKAEAAATWGHALDNRAFPSDAARATAAYNLGCFYARHGHAAAALPHLGLAFTLNPKLVEWAREDADLDPVRENVAIAGLLA